MKPQRLFWFTLLLLVLSIPILLFSSNVVQGEAVPAGLVGGGPGRRYTEKIPVFDVRDSGYESIRLTTDEAVSDSQLAPSSFGYAQDGSGQATSYSQFNRGEGNSSVSSYAVIRKTGPTFVQPGATARYEITLANYESITHTYRLTDTLPRQLAYVPDSAAGLVYDPATRMLSWQGELAPGHLDYIIEENSIRLPYLDLASFGAPNLCQDFLASEGSCDDVTVTFNLGVNGYTTSLYGEVLSHLTVSSNGLILSGSTAPSEAHGRNQWLPDTAAPNFLLAGLWRDVDMGDASMTGGRWHAAIITGLIEDHDVFYAQWHNASQASDSETPPGTDPSTPLRTSPSTALRTGLTARHAIAIVLNRTADLHDEPGAGDAFFIYDNISNPAQLVAQGYTIGIEDKLGMRGVTYAYAPCCGDSRQPQGHPPTAGTTLHLRPVLFGAGNLYSRTFSYEAVVNGQVPETIVNTVMATSSSNDPALASVWATHYLYVRRQTYLPFVQSEEATP